jgi:hypothetical protein
LEFSAAGVFFFFFFFCYPRGQAVLMQETISDALAQHLIFDETTTRCWCVGDEVKARWKDAEVYPDIWFHATIMATNAGGTFRIKYDDESVWNAAPSSSIIDPADAVHGVRNPSLSSLIQQINDENPVPRIGMLRIQEYLRNPGALEVQAYLQIKSLDLGSLAVCKRISGIRGLGTEEAKEVAVFLSKCEALSSFTFRGNLGGSGPITMDTSMTEVDCSGEYLGASGATMLAAFLPKCTVMTSLNVRESNMGADGAKHIAAAIKDMQVLPTFTFGNRWSPCCHQGYEATMTTTMTELDLSGHGRTELDYVHRSSLLVTSGDILMLSAFLPKCTALSVLNVASNSLGWNVLPEGWNCSDNELLVLEYTHTDGRKQDQHPGQPDGLIALADAIKDMAAITSVNLLSNSIPIDQAHVLVGILKAHPTLKSLCGNKGDETELDMSGRIRSGRIWSYGAEAVMLAAEISNNAAMSTVLVNAFRLPIQDIKSNAELDFSGKELNIDDASIIAALIPSNVALFKFAFGAGQQAITMTTDMTKADFREKDLGECESILLAAFLPMCTGLTKIDLPGPAKDPNSEAAAYADSSNGGEQVYPHGQLRILCTHILKQNRANHRQLAYSGDGYDQGAAIPASGFGACLPGAQMFNSLFRTQPHSTTASAAAPPGRVLLEGFLRKHGSVVSAIKHWRYFKLRPGVLSYWDVPRSNQGNPARIAHLTAASAAGALELSSLRAVSTREPKHPNKVELALLGKRGQDKIVSYTAVDDADAQRWRDALDGQIKQNVALGDKGKLLFQQTMS